MPSALPIPPSGIPVFNPITGAMDTQWQNYFLQLTLAITTGAAPADSAYWVSFADAALTGATNMGALPTGVIYQITAAGVATPHTEAQLNVLRGGTGSDLSITGGANQILQQSVAGAAVNVGTFAATQLSDYAVGSWTPADGSGAGLALTVTSASAARIGSVVLLQADITYPVTADGSNSRISGLPFTAIASKFPMATAGNFGAAYEAVVNASASTLDFLSAAGVRLTNALLSGVNLQWSGVYRT